MFGGIVGYDHFERFPVNGTETARSNTLYPLMTTLFTTRRFVLLLATTTLATYALLATGAALATTDAGSVCGTWPLCTDGFASPIDPALIAVLGHRLLAGVVGLLLALTTLGAWKTEANRRTRIAISGGVVLFVIQVGVGGLVVVTGEPVAGRAHLAIAAVLFTALLAALGWTLEGESTIERSTLDAADPAPSSATTSEPPSAPPSEPPSNPTQANAERSTRARLRSRGRSYLELTKPRLMWLLCLLALAGMALATTTGQWPDGVTVVATLAGGVLATGASGAFNHAYERDRDQQMSRTANRPVATDQVSAARATLFAFSLAVLSMVVLVTLVSLLVAALTLVAIIYYSVLYTVVLKPNTTWNIAIGGGSGALPAVIGWAAVTGSIGLPAIILALIVVVWTPAHFYNLAIVYRDDYARAGYPMFPVVSGVSAARRRVLLTLGGTLVMTTVLGLVTPLGWLFTLSTIIVGGLFLGTAVVQCRRRTDRATLRTFHASNAYLGVVLLAIVAEALVVGLRP
ncbi:heme o synthase [Natronosalvus rutilus]|uniref:Protoheme IX farnesyltransferase n=1 Tax=Natronosalvus rutilus TaxID=2953753 RepID=A0A9E7N5N9_9EURY|nr:heme o synthase [Natronosalvus rutilus]UTF52199.1 heme o synthase [Natronosalvus rutilus]